GGLEEGNGALLLLVGQDLREGDARGVVDADVDELPAAAAAAIVAGVMAGDAVADLVEAAELLDVEVDQLARLLALVAADRLGRLQVAQSAEAGPAQHAADRRGRDAGRGGDLPADPALPAQLDDLLAGRLSGRLAQPMRPRGPVIEAGRTLGLVALDPFPDRLSSDTEGSCHGAARLPLLQHAPDKLGPTQRRQAGILMHVHSAPRRSLKCRQLQLPRSGPDGQPIERSHLARPAAPGNYRSRR